MAGFIFEDGSQTQASSFLRGDQLIFRTATPDTLKVVFTPAANQTSVDTVTLTLGTFSLTFAAASLNTTGAGGTVLNFLNGTGTLQFGTTGPDTGATLAVSSASTSQIFGLSGDDSIAVGGTGAHIIDGGTGNDTITASGTGAYVLSGGAGNDTINATGANGNIHIYGNAFGSVAGAKDGDDLITIGGGTGTTAATQYVQGNAGNDSITVAAGSTTADLFRLNGGGDNDIISVANESSKASSFVNGNAGNDVITGGAGIDQLRGGQGDDSITLGTGLSQAFGDLGNDTLVAGTGTSSVSVLTGGAGNDVFVFGANSASSLHISPTQTAQNDAQGLFGYTAEIKDFASGADKIGLQNVAGAVTANIVLQEAGTTFAAGAQQAALKYAQGILDAAGADGAKHSIALIQVGTDTYLFSHENTAGNGTIDTAIKLDGVTAANVKAADFI